jgi:predicted nucleic acid-binding Zn ribbon protein
MTIKIGPDNRCPVCGRYTKKTIEQDRTVRACSNTTLDHDRDYE